MTDEQWRLIRLEDVQRVARALVAAEEVRALPDAVRREILDSLRVLNARVYYTDARPWTGAAR